MAMWVKIFFSDHVGQDLFPLHVGQVFFFLLRIFNTTENMPHVNTQVAMHPLGMQLVVCNPNPILILCNVICLLLNICNSFLRNVKPWLSSFAFHFIQAGTVQVQNLVQDAQILQKRFWARYARVERIEFVKKLRKLWFRMLVGNLYMRGC